MNWIFNLALSPRHMLPSFKGDFGRIEYLLEAKICSRSMQVLSKEEAELFAKVSPSHSPNKCMCEIANHFTVFSNAKVHLCSN